MGHTQKPDPKLESDSPPERILGTRVGWIVQGSSAGKLQVDFAGNRSGPLLARTTLSLDASEIEDAATRRQPAVLLFEEGDARKPLLIGLVQEPAQTPLLDELLSKTASAPSIEASADGRRVVIEAAEEILLKCGDASLLLRRNGKVLIKGAAVETHAAGVNRIKGGSVKIN